MLRLTRQVFCLVTCLMVCGCGASPNDKLVGTWVIDPEAMKETEGYKNASEAERQMMDSMGSSLKWEMTFTRDTVKMDMGMGVTEAKESPYAVKSVEGNTFVLTAKVQNGVESDMTVEVAGDQLILNSDGQSLTLIRK
jgi:hypothetical protein